MAAGEQHHQPFRPCSLRHRKEDVHRPAAGRAAAAAGHVLGKISSVYSGLLLVQTGIVTF